MVKQLVIGRSEEQVQELMALLNDLSYLLEVRCVPLIRIVPLAASLPASDTYDTLLFTSRNAVLHFFKLGGGIHGKRVLCIGEATASALPSVPDFVSLSGHAEGMVEELIQQYSRLQEARILHPTSELSERVLEQKLAPVVSSFSTLTIYSAHTDPAVPLNLSADYAVYYSPSAVSAWAERSSSRPVAISIGPSTTRRLKEHGWSRIHQTKAPTAAAIFYTLNEQLSLCIQKSE